MMGEAELVEALGKAGRTVDRVQARPVYDVASDLDNYRRYADGRPGPDTAAISAFHGWLAAERDRGVAWRQLLIPPVPLNPYWRYACEWGYAYHTGHEDIRVLDLAGRSLPALWRDGFPVARGQLHDFYVVDSRVVLGMSYDNAGGFLGALNIQPPDDQLTWWPVLWDAAADFTAWWDAHPEYKRGPRAA